MKHARHARHARTTTATAATAQALQRRRRALIAFAGTALLAIAATVQVSTARAQVTDDMSLQQKLQACRSGNTYQSRESCIAEARAVNAARAQGQIQTYGNHAANALARCNIYRDEEGVLACRARVMGLGEVSGSVAGGGLLREYDYLVPADPARTPGAGQDTAQAAPQQQAMGAGAALQARPPEPYKPLQPILQTSPAFPMY